MQQLDNHPTPVGFKIHNSLVNGYNFASSSLSSLKGRSVELLTNTVYGVCATPKAPLAISATTIGVAGFVSFVGGWVVKEALNNSNVSIYIFGTVCVITSLASIFTVDQSISLYSRIISAGKDAQLTLDEKRVKYSNPELYAEYVLSQSQLKKFA